MNKKQSLQVELILKKDWYKTASQEEMRIALMHIQQSAIDGLFNQLGQTAKDYRQGVFDELGESCGWGE